MVSGRSAERPGLQTSHPGANRLVRALASRRNRLWVVAAATLLVLALGVARALDPLAEGLGAT